MRRRSTPRHLLHGLILTLGVLGAGLVVLVWLYTLLFLGSEDADLTDTPLEDLTYVGTGLLACLAA